MNFVVKTTLSVTTTTVLLKLLPHSRQKMFLAFDESSEVILLENNPDIFIHHYCDKNIVK